MHLKNNNQPHLRSGQAYILFILIFTAILTTIAVGLAAINRTNTTTLTNQVQATQALYVAQAGIESAISQLRQNSTWRTGFTNVIFPSSTTSTYTVTVSGAMPDLTLLSNGTVNDITKTLRVGISILASPLATTQQTAPFVVAINTWTEE